MLKHQHSLRTESEMITITDKAKVTIVGSLEERKYVKDSIEANVLSASAADMTTAVLFPNVESLDMVLISADCVTAKTVQILVKRVLIWNQPEMTKPINFQESVRSSDVKTTI